MNKPIVFISQKQVKKNLIEIVGSDVHHLLHVLKLTARNDIICRTFEGFNYQCVLHLILKDKLILNIKEKNVIKEESIKKIHLVLSMPKPKTFSSVVKKITELGVASLYPVITERSFIKDEKAFNLKRYQKISLESLKQSMRSHPMKISNILKIQDFLTTEEKILKSSFKIFPWECAQNDFFKESFQTQKEMMLFIGPEGGVTQKEKIILEAHGFKVVSLSKNILRVETAVLFSIAKLF